MAQALDPELDKPYHLRVVLHLAENRLLTPVFKDQVQRELRDGLKAALGAMGKVEVVAEHPLLPEIAARGLQQALDGWKEVSAIKTHFVLIDFVDGRYVVQARQHDGSTGLASPLVRRAETTDRLFVARTAALLIDRDFGLVGTVAANVKGNDVRLLLKGSALETSPERLVKEGDVFALVQISQAGGEVRATRVPWALLQVVHQPKIPADGVRCRLLHRYKDPLAGSATLLGHRCLKLATTQAPLHLRLVDDQRLLPLPNQRVTVSRHDFEGKIEEDHSTDADGMLITKKSYANLAFVRVLSGTTVRARIPIEILGERTVACPISVNPQAELLGQLELQRRQWLGQLYESTLVIDDLYKQLNKLVEGKDDALALKKAREGVALLHTEIPGRTKEMQALRTHALEIGPETRLDLSEGEQRLRDLKTRQGELERFLKNLEYVVKQETDPRRVELLGMVERARLLESEAEYEPVIALYKKIVASAADEPKVRKHAEERLDELAKAWAIRNEKHGQARAFIYETWPKLEKTFDLNAQAGKAHEAFQECRAVNDVLTPRMLLKANVAHITRLKKRLEALQPKDNEDDRIEAAAIVNVAEHLQKLTTDVTQFLKK